MWIHALFVCMFDKLANLFASTCVVIVGWGLCCVYEILYEGKCALRRTCNLIFLQPCSCVGSCLWLQPMHHAIHLVLLECIFLVSLLINLVGYWYSY